MVTRFRRRSVELLSHKPTGLKTPSMKNETFLEAFLEPQLVNKVYLYAFNTPHRKLIQHMICI